MDAVRTVAPKRDSHRAEPDQVHEIHKPSADQFLSASEIGSYTFCAQAWHLGRRNVAREAEGAERLVEGTVAHRNIGARADRVLAIELVRRLLIVAICGLATILLVQPFSARTLPMPW